MTKKEIHDMIIMSEENVDFRMRLEEEEVRDWRQHLNRARKYGYEICLVLLYNSIYYFEKIKDGDRESYEKSFRDTGVKKEVKKYKRKNI